jgi:hypothetical protein
VPVAPQRLARGSAFQSIDEHLAIHHHARHQRYPTNLLACVGSLRSGMREKARWGASQTGVSASKERREISAIRSIDVSLISGSGRW